MILDKRTHRIIIVVALVIFLFLLYFIRDLSRILLPILERTLCSDRSIDSGVEGIRTVLLIPIAGALLFLSGLFLYSFQGFRKFFRGFFFHEAVGRFFLQDDLLAEVNTPVGKRVFAVSSLLSLLLSICYVNFRRTFLYDQYLEDGFFESATVVLYFISVLMLLTVLIRHRDVLGMSGGALRLRVVVILLCLAILFVSMEEISWGQRIFHWETPALLRGINVQNETNVHNIFNSLYGQLYRVGSGLFFFILLIGWIPPRSERSFAFKLVFPHPSLFPVTFAILITSRAGFDELCEELLSLFVFFYSYRILIIARQNRK